MILNVYKPIGWSSFDVCKYLKRKHGYKKVGHAGTLDPLAEGVLVVLTDEDTKWQDEIMKMPKIYEVGIGFGYTSPSFDLGTPLTKTNFPENITQEGIQEALSVFIGETIQEVPVFSAVKRNGTPLYKLARKEAEVLNLPKRKINISDIKLLSYSNNAQIVYPLDSNEVINLPILTIRVYCEHGTYMRALARDLGIKLNTTAICTSIKRCGVGEYKIEDSVDIK